MSKVKYMKPNNPIQIVSQGEKVSPVTLADVVRFNGSNSVQDILDIEHASYGGLTFVQISKNDYDAIDEYDESVIYLIH